MNANTKFTLKLLSLILIGLLPASMFSQVDTINYEKLFNSMSNCQTLTENIQALIPRYAQPDPPKAKQLLDIWEKTCDPTEPSQRMYILIEIAGGKFNEYQYYNYYQYMIKKFKDRMEDSKDKDYKQIYDSSKVYYNYIPLRGEYDQYTRDFARSLIDKQDKNSSAYLLCVLFSGDIDEFNKLVIKDDYNKTAVFKSLFADELPDISDIVHLGVGAGIWMPFGTLAHSFNINPTIGLNARVNIKNWSYGLEFHFRIPNNNNPFEISAQDTLFSVKESFGMSFGLLVCRLMKINDKFLIEGISGIGIDNIQTDKEKPDHFNDNEETLYYNITTLNLNAGIGFWYKLGGRKELGLQLRYMYSPYRWDKNLTKSIGTSAFMVSAYYGF